jgi:uncharacterized protein (DUF305 family)
MRESQTREIAEMKDTRKNLTGSEATPEKLPDAYMQAAMTKMRGMSGPALDQAFLNMMIAHHASALEVGKRAEANVRTPSLKVLAGRMFVSQLRDIDAMNELRERPPPSIDVAGDDTMVGDRRVPLTPANDLVFVDYFIAHHEHELELLKLGASRASEPAVKLIAQKTIENRTKDLERLRDLRGEVGTVEAPAAPIDRYRRQLLDRLGRATGAEFDRMFLEALAAHHGTAIAPAARAEGHLTRPELRAFARALYDIQIAEATDAYRTRESVD